VRGSPVHGEGDSQSQEEVDYIRICTLCSNPIHITSELPEWSTVCRICLDNSNVELSKSLLFDLQCCFENCTLDQYSPCQSCKRAFCAKHAEEHGDCNKKTNLTAIIPNVSAESVDETISSREDLRNVAQDNLTTAQQDLMTSQATLHSFLNTLSYADPGNYNIMSTL